ncbi:amidohydrolase family protein [Marinomonas sp. C2222]|uniref:Amidohydrolase family protein n=1 Tax=Marinomonas sargassi TaxID=2984494 RepID=A0ABT2YTD5_9GAMM|nr:amidohydrolase family protein [Marinomonas sargassi]MCV2403153.1 amidohydrolase family protein [Marinomonas sargassi]
MKKLALFTLLTLMTMSVSANSESAKIADTLFINGKILTVDEDFSIAQSLAIRDGRIVAVGSNAMTEPLIGDQTKLIDLKGKTVIPGLIDNHLHFIRGVWNFKSEVRLDGIESRTEAMKKIRDRAKQLESGKWITVMGGWSYEQFLDDNAGFSLQELDEIAPDNPLFLMRGYSEGFANSKAFELAEVENGGQAQVKGRDTVGEFINLVSWRNKRSDENAIRTYMKELNRVGLTTVYDVGRPSEGDLGALEDFAESGDMPLRVFHTLRYNARDAKSTESALKMIESDSILPRSNDEQFGLLGLGEHIYSPVTDNPRNKSQWKEEVWGPFTQISFAAARNGWPVHEHVMSQVMAEQYLDLVEDIAVEVPTVKDLRWTFAHVNGMKDEDIARAAELGIAFAVHNQARMSVQIFDSPRIGSIANSGALWGLGSDAGIVAPYQPFITLEWVVAGTNVAAKATWGEDQRVSREQALIAHTRNNAELLFMEQHIGSLEVGKLADLVVLDKDYLTVEENEISELMPLLTMTGGKVVYSQASMD